MDQPDTKDIERQQRKQDILLQKQLNEQNAQLEAKRQSVFQERKRILDAQRGPIWTPQQPYIAPPPPPTKKPRPLTSGPTVNIIDSVFGRGNNGL
jgi:hypothetical protein